MRTHRPLPMRSRRAAGHTAHGDIVAGEAYKRVTWGDTFVAVHCVQPVASVLSGYRRFASNGYSLQEEI